MKININEPIKLHYSKPNSNNKIKVSYIVETDICHKIGTLKDYNKIQVDGVRKYIITSLNKWLNLNLPIHKYTLTDLYVNKNNEDAFNILNKNMKTYKDVLYYNEVKVKLNIIESQRYIIKSNIDMASNEIDKIKALPKISIKNKIKLCFLDFIKEYLQELGNKKIQQFRELNENGIKED